VFLLTQNILLQISNAKPTFSGDDFVRVLPEFIVLIMATLLVILDLFLTKRTRPYLAYLAIAGYAGAIVASGFLY